MGRPMAQPPEQQRRSDTAAIERVLYDYCSGMLDSAVREVAVLRNENAALRQRSRAGASETLSKSYGQRVIVERPALRIRPPHDLP